MKKNRYLMLILCFFLACQSSQDKTQRQAYLPPDGKIFTFVHELDYDAYNQNNMPETFGIALYATLSQDASFSINGTNPRKLDVVLDSLAQKPLLMMLRPSNAQLKKIVDGKADSEMEAFANTLKSYKNNIYLTIGHEVNNPRYMLVTSLYVEAHRKLVEKFRDENVRNVSYVWHIIGMKPREGMGAPVITLESCYPGDNYVDWVGLSMHNISPHHYADGTFFEKSTYDEVVDFAAGRGLPMMICESSTRSVKANYEFTGDSLWVDWYEPFFEFVENNNVRAITHIFYSFDDEVILNRWREKMRQQEYIIDGS